MRMKEIESRIWRWGIGLVVVMYATTALLFVWRTPPWQAPDEPAHFNYVRHVAETGLPPVLTADCYDQAYLDELKATHFPPDKPIDSICYEAHQPPLYYALAAPVYRLAVWVGVNPLYAVRLFSAFLGLGVIFMTWRLAVLVFPSEPLIPLAAAGLSATLPMHVAMLSVVNNDGLAELVLTANVWYALRVLRAPVVQRRAWVAQGLLLACALLTKTTAYVALPLVVGALFWAYRRHDRRVRYESLGLVLVSALVLAAPWFVRNAVVYGNGDITGLARHDAIVVGQPRTAEWVAELGVARTLKRLVFTTFHSFWGQFGWMAAPLPSNVYSLLWALTLLAVVGLLLYARFGVPRPAFPESVWVLLAWMSLTVGGFLWYNLTFVQHQGRYLFPALPAVALFTVLGWREWIAPRYQWLALGLVLWWLWWLAVWSAWVILPGLG
ncbi:DUF2142 domain-containing protein [Ardenticatena maritima]|nr:DUF2142 domain-containing protein [Ardenticatena maritima]